jgi:hypothetical protein
MKSRTLFVPVRGWASDWRQAPAQFHRNGVEAVSNSGKEFIWGATFILAGVILQFLTVPINGIAILSDLPGTGRILIVLGAGFVVYGLFLRSKEKRNRGKPDNPQ